MNTEDLEPHKHHCSQSWSDHCRKCTQHLNALLRCHCATDSVPFSSILHQDRSGSFWVIANWRYDSMIYHDISEEFWRDLKDTFLHDHTSKAWKAFEAMADRIASTEARATDGRIAVAWHCGHHCHPDTLLCCMVAMINWFMILIISHGSSLKFRVRLQMLIRYWFTGLSGHTLHLRDLQRVPADLRKWGVSPLKQTSVGATGTSCDQIPQRSATEQTQQGT